ncbi:hypothetical protein FRX31_009226 [Thalictrum thalictroides]|uniref:Uncharacterized protein n=1 Tax=Thalictrum thalictroides TaxID=46969 RepID=A0A7J6WUT5_THATH|nr:hypothetical protein FRX31_009226 [Thalictrum thalictroides]
MSVESSTKVSLSNKILSQSSDGDEDSGEGHKNKRIRSFFHDKKEEEKKSYICMYNADIMQEIFLRLPLKSLHRDFS